MRNKVTWNITVNSSVKNINFFINALAFQNAVSQLNSLMPRRLLCSARSLVNKVVDIQYLSLILQKLSDVDNLDAVKSVHQSQLSNWVRT